MADKKDETEAKGKKGGLMSLLIPLVGGGVGVLILTIPIVLFSQGIIQLDGPRMQVPESYILADSLLSQHYQSKGLLSEEGLALMVSREAEMLAEAARIADEEEARILREQEAEIAALREAKITAEAAKTEAVPVAQPPANAGQVSRNAEQELPFDKEKLSRLVKVYEKMRAKQVAMILNTMSESKSAMILANMKDKNAAEVLAAIDADKAARLSELIVRMTVSAQ